MTDYCCVDCKYLETPFETDDWGVPKPTNPYCKLGNDENFPKKQSQFLEWINHAEYYKHICDDFKPRLLVRLHLVKPYLEQLEERNKIWEDLE